MLYVRVRDRWRRVLYKVQHPAGERYALLPMKGEPDTVAVATIERTPWRKRVTTPDPLPRLVS